MYIKSLVKRKYKWIIFTRLASKSLHIYPWIQKQYHLRGLRLQTERPNCAPKEHNLICTEPQPFLLLRYNSIAV